MPVAYTTVRTANADPAAVRDRILSLDGVAEAHVVSGDVDVLVEFRTGSLHELSALLTDHVQRLEGVENTHTYVALD